MIHLGQCFDGVFAHAAIDLVNPDLIVSSNLIVTLETIFKLTHLNYSHSPKGRVLIIRNHVLKGRDLIAHNLRLS